MGEQGYYRVRDYEADLSGMVHNIDDFRVTWSSGLIILYNLFICLVTMVERYYYMTQLFICLVTMVELRSTQGGSASLDTGK